MIPNTLEIELTNVFTCDMKFDDQYNLMLRGKMSEHEFSKFIDSCNDTFESPREMVKTRKKKMRIFIWLIVLKFVAFIAGLIIFLIYRDDILWYYWPLFYIPLVFGTLYCMVNFIGWNSKFHNLLEDKVSDLRNDVKSYCREQNLEEKDLHIVVKKKQYSAGTNGSITYNQGFFVPGVVIYLEFQFVTEQQTIVNDDTSMV
jgi:hypothetical protein